MDLSKLKRKTLDVNKLVEAAQEVSGSNGNKGTDARFWAPTVDKAGNGYSVIRFLPSADDVDVPWARYFDHGFKGPTGLWYIEKSLTSIGQQDPVSEMNSKIWARGDDASKNLVRERKRRLHYVTNILVISDPSAPDNEGKVFMYKFGKKIFDKIMDVMQPEFPDEAPINPFDLWSGADFVLKIRKVEGYRNYDKSEFKSASELLDGDEDKLQAVADTLHSLKEFTDPSNYKTYEELQGKLIKVLGESPKQYAEDVPRLKQQEASPQRSEAAPEAASKDVVEEVVEEDDDDTMSYFQKLAQE